MTAFQQQTKTVRVTVLYPLPIQAFSDDFFKRAAASRDGKFIGSGADTERDLAFDFPKYPYQFIELVESCGSRVEVSMPVDPSLLVLDSEMPFPAND